jgi:N-terminal domain of anti-restriction factor ArdC
MRTTTAPKVSDEERAERRRADREYARQAVEQLRTSEGWQRWLATRRHFHPYSLGNQLLIAMTRPTATRVAGFRKWLELGYAVERGEHAIKIWAPCPPSRKQLERWQHEGAHADQRPRIYFKLVPVACVARPRQRQGEGDGCGLRGRRGVGARGRRRSGDRAHLAGTPGNRSALTSCRECCHPVPIPAISRTDGKSPKAAALHQERPRRRRRPRDRNDCGAAASGSGWRAAKAAQRLPGWGAVAGAGGRRARNAADAL